MKRTNVSKLMAFLLAVLMLVSLFPLTVFAEGVCDGTAECSAVEHNEGCLKVVSEPETPKDPETPETPKDPETPETPKEPEVPETPKDPETPETPKEPEIPVTTKHRRPSKTPAVPEAVQDFLDAVNAIRIPDEINDETGPVLNGQIGVASAAYDKLTAEDLQREDVNAALVKYQKAVDKLSGGAEPIGPAYSTVKLTIYVYTPSHERVLIGQLASVDYNPNAVSETKAYKLPSLDFFLDQTQYKDYDFGRVTEVRSTYRMPTGGSAQVGQNVYFGTNNPNNDVVYWVTKWAPAGSGEVPTNPDVYADVQVLYVNNENTSYENGPSGRFGLDCSSTSSYHTHGNNCDVYLSGVKAAGESLHNRTGYTLVGWTKNASSFASPSASWNGTTLFNNGSYGKDTFYVIYKSTEPLTPQPTYDDLKDLLGDEFVRVHCTNDKVAHNDGLYGLMEGSYNLEKVNGTTYTLTVNAAQYVTAYGNGHRLANGAPNSATVTLTYANSQWSASPTQITFDVVCDEEPEPPAPDKPKHGDLSDLLGDSFVNVDCVNETAGHANKSYALIDGSYTSTDVVKNDEDVYTFTITVAADKYVEKYNEELSGHTLTGDSSKTVTLTWDAEDEEWTANPESITFTVICDEEPEPTAPEKPEHGDLSKLLGEEFVKVDCVNGNVDHPTKSYALMAGSYTSTEVESFEGGYYFSISVNPAAYVAAYNQDVKDGHSAINNKLRTVVLTWDADAEKWVPNPASITIDVECNEPTAPEKPGYEDLSKLLGKEFVKVDCINGNVDHPTKSYALIAGSYESTEVENEEGVYYFTIHVEAADYVAAYNRDVKDGHTLRGDAKKPVVLTWNAVAEEWEVNPKSVTFTVICDEPTPEKFTVTYNDGVRGKQIFADQVYRDVAYGSVTPKFQGEPTRKGYIFKGWEPEVAQYVTANVTYKATWEKDTHPGEPEEETISWSVRKVWKDSYSASRPTSVTVQLKRNGTAWGDPVKLNKDNNWRYTWTDLPKDGVYEIIETAVPKGYKASYSTSANTVTITNTKTQTVYTSDGKLIQTGQLNWPVPVLSAMGMALMSAGLYLFFQKKKGRYES